MIIGITGSFGTGKTTVVNIFKKFGCKVLDADKIAHRFLKKNSPAYKKIISVFGQSMLKKDKIIDRRKLAEIVFDNKVYLNKLCNIIHPYVIGEIKKTVLKIQKRLPNNIIAIDAPLLIEANLASYVDRVIVVTTPLKIQIKRCSTKFGLTPKEVKKRIKSQMALAQKLKFADFVIDNSGSLSNTTQQVKRIYDKLSG